MDYLAYKNIPMGLISGVCDCKTTERKIKWVKENYGYLLENYCVSSQEQKIIELKVLAKVNRLHENQITIIDNLYPDLEKQKVKDSLLFPQCRGLLILPRLHKITIFHCRIC